MSPAPLQPVFDLAEPMEGREAISFTLGPAGEVNVLAASPADAFVAIGRHGGERIYDAALLVVRGGEVSHRELSGLAKAFPIVQPLPDGKTLLVGSRAERTAEGHELNAAVYSAEGILVREFLLGDGIEDVQTSADGAIWVSYFDEGIFGNYGWGEAEGPAPIGASGLARFDRLGVIEWEFEPPTSNQAIADCYALNVSDEVAWAYYYDSFPLIRIDGDAITSWDTPVGGARAIVIREETVWLVGGYGNDRTRCVICRFGDRSLVEQRRFDLTTPSGELSREARVAARGESIYALDGAILYSA